MDQLSGQDASFVYKEASNTPMHVGSVGIYDPSTTPNGAVRFKDILAHIASCMHLARTFRRKLLRVPGDVDNPYWVDDDRFDIEFHVRHLALPQPGDWRQLCIQVARLHSRAVDLNRPLWEFYIIEGLDRIEGLPPGCFALQSKMHHAAVDGASGVEMLSAVHTLEPDARPSVPSEPWRPRTQPSAAELLLRAHVNSISHPMQWMEALHGATPLLDRLREGSAARELRLDALKPAPPTRFQKPCGPHRVFDGLTLSFADVRAMRSAVSGATINDVILAIVGGALRRYLMKHDELPAESLISAVPISVRGKEDNASMGNRISMMVVSLGTNVSDPVERLQVVHTSAQESKAITNAVGAQTLASYSDLIPSGLASLGARVYSELGLSEEITRLFNCVVSNVPGPRKTLYMAGARLVTQHGLAPLLNGVTLAHPVYSYGDIMTLDFTADREVMPDPAFYASCIQSSFDELRDRV